MLENTDRKLGPTIGLFKQAFFKNIMLQTTFPVVLPRKMKWTNFQKKDFVVLGEWNSILFYDVNNKSEKVSFGKHWQVTYQQTQNDPLSRNLLIVLVN